MSDDLPYKAEYAKSGRAGCKGCKTNISQDSLRIAKMVQSPHFDGKMPQWYHYGCFFKKFKPNSHTDIGKIDSLRWEDQEKVKEMISGGSSSKKKTSKTDTVDGPPANQNQDFLIEYSKSGRAKCRACEEKIEKGVVRIAKMVEPDERIYGIDRVPNWYHVDCFVTNKVSLDAESLAASEIPGFTNLSGEDGQQVSTKLGNNKKVKNKPKKQKQSKEEKLEDKKENEHKEKLKNQSKKFWEIRDELLRNFKNSFIKALLDANNVDSSGGESHIFDRCTDGMMFGALEPCPECQHGRLRYSDEGYVCTGNISGWTRCLYKTLTPKRRLWKIPDEFKEDSPFLQKFKPEIRERLFPLNVSKNGNTTIKEEEGKPLVGKKIVLVGKLKQTKAQLKSKIEELDGQLVDNPTKACFCCISSPGEVMKLSAKMVKIQQYNIPVVAEDYLDAITKGGAQSMINQYAIAPWGNKAEKDSVDGGSGASRKRKVEMSGFEALSTKKAKMTMKGGAVVDPDSGLEDKCHVFSRKNCIYAAVLGMVDLTRGTNSYYKIQLLEHDTKKGVYYVFRAWGRVGTSIGGNKVEKFYDCEDAIFNFKEVYEEKTGNRWEKRKDFVKYPSRFYPIDIDYGQDDEALKNSIEPGSLSTLANPIKELIKMIFDIEAMKHALVEFEIDLKKMPLGKLSKKQIESAYSCLNECQKLMSEGITSGSKILDASNRFFTLIPHDFGLRKPPLIDNEELLNMKIKMLDSLLEIEIAYSLMKGGNAKGDKDPIDVHYESLKADLDVLDKKSEEFKMICEYVKNTHAKTHSSYSLSVEEVYTVNRHGEKQRYKAFRDLHNRKLLWHGSRMTNFAGILSQGLRIAPPEAPVTGYMFGKGVYFADMASKSANYCYASRSTKNTGLMLLCEVALGNTYDLTSAKHITKLPAGKHSCKGIGATAPDPSGDKILSDGVVVPMGEGKQDASLRSSLLYNEYIVYDTSQINMKYLVKLGFNFKY